jgi:outer membrane receptor protein involved in Fe transport
MKKQLLSFLLAFFSLASVAFAQKGKVVGKIIDKSNAEGLFGASVRIDGTSIGSIADIDGGYEIETAPGKYILEISFVSFSTAKVEVEIKENEIVYLNHAMEEAAAVSLAQVVVVATVERSTNAAVMIERKKAAQISDGVSADLIRKTPDRTTSDVLKRVTGASIQEGKFVIIRGMNDRYNAGFLDGALLPSTESDRKAFAFDAIPANLVDNLVIFKAATPDMIGDFGGGIIKINTKSVPEKFSQSLNIGFQMHELTTFKDFNQYKRYSGEAFNFISPKRNLPEIAEGGLRTQSVFPSPADRARLEKTSQAFNNDWSAETVTAAPNPRFMYSLGLPIRLGDGKKLGVVLALTYANSRRISQGKVNSYDGNGQTSEFSDDISYNNISAGGILNLSYVSNKTQISLRNLLNTNQDNNAYARTGTANITDALSSKNRVSLINFNRLYSTIASLKQIFGDNFLTLNTSVSYADVLRTIPDYRIANYFKTPDFPNFQVSTGDFFQSSSGRFSSSLNEGVWNGNFDLSKSFGTTGLKTDIKVGYNYQKRDRKFSGRNFVYNGTTTGDSTLNPAIDFGAKAISASGMILIEKTNDDNSYYAGVSDLHAAFLSIDQRYGKFRATYGVRYEDLKLDINNWKLNRPVSGLDSSVFLPSVNLVYAVNDKVNLRASYFASVNRPEFRELAPFAFYAFDKNSDLRGNKALEIAKLNNFDVRFEYYPTAGQLISIGGFYKAINKPIEFTIDVTQPFTTFSYQNEKSATIYGVELEVKKTLDFIGSAKVFSDMAVFANLSVTKSQLKFDSTSVATQNRTLQGQSPYIINAGFQYESAENGWFGSVVFNRIGRRIAYVGVDEKFGATRQDIYEAPRNVLDFQVGKNIGALNIKFTMGDLFRNDQVFYQDSNKDGKFTPDTTAKPDLLMFKYNNGFTATLGLGYTF